VLLKPKSLGEGINQKIIAGFEKYGFKLISMKFAGGDKQHMSDYFHHAKGKGFHDDLIEYCTSNGQKDVWIMVWEGVDVINQAQKICGYTNPGALSGHFLIT